jgi:hypothetical protein
MPLFDWGQVVNDSAAKEKQAQVYEKNWSQAKTDLWRDWNKAQDSLSSLKYQEKINDTAVKETERTGSIDLYVVPGRNSDGTWKCRPRTFRRWTQRFSRFPTMFRF